MGTTKHSQVPEREPEPEGKWMKKAVWKNVRASLFVISKGLENIKIVSILQAPVELKADRLSLTRHHTKLITPGRLVIQALV